MSRYQVFNLMGCPIRKSWGQRSFAPNPSLSQLITSFIACESQGIRHSPFPTFARALSSIKGKHRLIILSAEIFLKLYFYEKICFTSCLQYVKDRFVKSPWGELPLYGRFNRSENVDKKQGDLAYAVVETFLNYSRLSSRKEVFQPHLPVRLPCYDLAPITSFALGRSLR